MIPVAGYYRVDVGPLLFIYDAVFPLLDTEICVISSAVGQMFLLVEKMETSEGYDGYVLKDKVCSPLKTVEYMTCPLATVHCSILKGVVYSMLIKKKRRIGFAPLDTRRESPKRTREIGE